MSSTPVSAPSPARKVPTRRISFEESLRAAPRHFAQDGDLVSSHVIAALSALFPDGEDFFVRSVRHFRDHVTEPELKRSVAGFIGQEAMHGREHRAFNEHLDELGYPTKRVERIVDRFLRARERIAPAKANLAVTAALEHFTAVLAEVVLEDDDVRRLMGHEAVRDLFVWHALEEAEHKAVAFDVYRAVGGGERLRILTMKFVRLGFVAVMVAQLVASLATDRATYRRGNLRTSLVRFFRSPVMRPEMWRRLREYDRRGFHPNDRDTDGLVERWREELFGAEGTLNDKLVRASAA